MERLGKAMAKVGFRKVSYAVAIAIGLAGAGCGAYAVYLQLIGNFHPVIEGQFYRSAQPSADDLAAYVRAHGIKTVINLRGAHPDTSWYDDEVAMSKGLNVTHIDFGMSSSKDFSADRADQLVALMKNAPKPILIHCQSGADRSGLVSALYAEKVAGLDEAQARRQLSFYYGHVGIPVISAAYAMDRSWQTIEARDDRQISASVEPPNTLR
jgi:protein tyrosine/serine phosphatase